MRHHLALAALVAAGLAVAHAAAHAGENRSDAFRWSMATAYVGLALIVAALAVGPVNVLRRRPNPASGDLRRDVGIWAGLVSVGHVVAGFQVHMGGALYKYFFADAEHLRRLRPRLDAFGFTNDLGLFATLVVLVLLATSNDLSLRRLGAARWKAVQRWTYAMAAAVAVHGVVFQLLEKRSPGWVALFAVLLVAGAGLQAAGRRAFAGWRSARAARAQGIPEPVAPDRR